MSTRTDLLKLHTRFKGKIFYLCRQRVEGFSAIDGTHSEVYSSSGNIYHVAETVEEILQQFGGENE